jgi:hypothetical protein
MHNMDCWDSTCNARVYLNDRQYKQHKERGSTFYCTAGHSQVFRPSENDKLRSEIKRLKATIEALKRDVRISDDYASRLTDTWKCPFGGCYHESQSKGSMVRHIKNKHKDAFAPKMLPANAGPSAQNTVVY